MSHLIVRRLLIDLRTPIAVRWHGGDAFRSAFFNALSMSFPVGEQYFIDSMRKGLAALPPGAQAQFAKEVQAFIGQEATHRRMHSLFNDHLAQQGMVNQLEIRTAKRIRKYAHRSVRIHLAATAATEHLTSLLAHWLLTTPEALEGCEERLRTLWLWHSAEEAEHRCTAFDLYLALGGDLTRRKMMFHYITLTYSCDLLRQTVRNLWHDKALFRWSTWRSAWQFLTDKNSLLRSNRGAWSDYLRPDYHPSQHSSDRSAQWLDEHKSSYLPVG